MDRAAYLSQLHAQFEVPPALLAGLVERSTPGHVVAMRRLISGDEYEVHRVALANDAVVYVRISLPGTPPSKVRHEAWAMQQARDGGVPVPDVLAVEAIGERYAMVMAAASGVALDDVLSSLTPDMYAAAMTDLGRVMARLHNVRMPGSGVPDDDGIWSDAESHRRRYLGNVLADCEQLAAAGLARSEIDEIIATLENAAELLIIDRPVLCHGDFGHEHIFVDDDMRISGLIDWGMWAAGSAASDLAAVATRHTESTFAAVLSGHSGESPGDPELRRAILCCAVAQLVGLTRWHVQSNQTALLPRSAARIRQALADLSD